MTTLITAGELAGLIAKEPCVIIDIAESDAIGGTSAGAGQCA